MHLSPDQLLSNFRGILYNVCCYTVNVLSCLNLAVVYEVRLPNLDDSILEYNRKAVEFAM